MRTPCIVLAARPKPITLLYVSEVVVNDPEQVVIKQRLAVKRLTRRLEHRVIGYLVESAKALLGREKPEMVIMGDIHRCSPRVLRIGIFTSYRFDIQLWMRLANMPILLPRLIDKRII